ncbi:RNA polymerase sigma factor [Spirosoma sp.]|uniref:RNA polymerase sigma factor n=1 Tax=Spirosoma sp. TaxID=1899569 RepID=UPI003B3B4E6F
MLEINLIRSYLAGEPNNCLDILYRRYRDKVYYKCLSMTKNPAIAEDYTHDIFIKVFNKLPNFQHKSCFSTWLYSIAHNYCLDQLRKASRFHFTEISGDMAHTLADDFSDTTYEVHLFTKTWNRLSQQTIDLFRQKYEENKSLEEIAVTAKTSVPAVKMRLMRARNEFKAKYIAGS